MALALTYLLVSSSTVNAFLVKWRTLNSAQYGFALVLEHKTPRPYAYRVLMPTLVNGLAKLEPIRRTLGRPLLLDRGVQRYMPPDSVAHWSADLRVKYLIAGFLMVGFLMLAMFSLRGLTRTFYPDSRVMADAGPILFGLALPLTFRGESGFLYDFSEMGLFFLGVHLLARRRLWAFLGVLPLILLNKESNAVVWVFSAVILLSRRPWRQALLHLGLQAAVIGGILLGLWTAFADSPGGMVELHAMGNLRHWSRLSTYLDFMTTGVAFVPVPKPHNIVLLILLVWLAVSRWRSKPVLARRLFLASAILNLPLMLLFCYRDEWRNLSLMFPFYYLLACDTILRFYSDDGLGLPGSSPGPRRPG